MSPDPMTGNLSIEHLRRKQESYLAVRSSAHRWTTKCSNYFRVPNGRVVTQWPRSAGSFWGMTRRFKLAHFRFEATAGSVRKPYPAVDGGSR